MKYVGLSLSFCVRDLIEGKKSLDEVTFIYSGTRCENKEHWESVIKTYRISYWYDNPDEGERLARYFIENGLIIQPRLEGRYHTGRHEIWVEQSEFNKFAKEHAIVYR